VVNGKMDLIPHARRVGGLLYTAQGSNNYKLVTFTSRMKLHGEWGPRLRRSVCRGWSRLPWHSYWLPGVLGTDMDDAREGSWGCCFVVLSLLGR
jgi:hypothetical protein